LTLPHDIDAFDGDVEVARHLDLDGDLPLGQLSIER